MGEGGDTHTHVCGVTSMSEHTPRSLPVPDGSAAGPTCQKTTRAHLCVELLVIIICSVPPYLMFNFFLHEQQLSMLWHFNSTAKSPPPQPHTHTHTQHIYLLELIKSLSSLFSPPTTSHPTSLSPFLITKDTVIIAGWGGGGGRGQKRRAHVCRHGQTCQA